MPHKWTYLLTALLLVVSTQLLAQSGIEHHPFRPDYESGSFTSKVTDMEVKVSGASIRIVREWHEGAWHWNRRWNPIELVGLTEEDEGISLATSDSTSSSSTSLSTTSVANLPYGIIRNGAHYQWDTLPTHISHLAITDRHYIDGARRIDVNNAGESYTWSDRLGNVIHYEGNIIDIDDSQDVYQPVMPMAWYQDKNGNRISVSRNSVGDITSVSANDTVVLTYTYNAGRVQKITDYSGRAVEYFYTDGLLTSVRDVRGEVWTYTYDSKGLLASYTTPEDYTVTLTLDANGVLLSAIGDDGVGTTYTSGYNSGSDSYTSQEVDSTGKVTERYYNALGHLVRLDVNGELRYHVDTLLSDNSTNVRKLVTSSFAGLGTLSTSSSGSAISLEGAPPADSLDLTYIKTRLVTDAKGQVTRYDYDQWHNPIKITYPDGGIETRRYHANYSFATQIIDESGVITEFDYDAAGNVIKQVEAKGLAEQRITTYTYDTQGNLLSRTIEGDENTAEATIQFTYDSFGNISTLTDAEGAITQLAGYDALGLPATITNAREKVWTRQYDAAGNLTLETDPDNRSRSLSYDKAGRLVKLTTSDAAETTFTYEGSLLTQIIDPVTETVSANPSDIPYETRLDYDAAGRLIKATDATGRSTQTQYDSFGRLQNLIDGVGHTTRYQYQDNQLSQVDYPTYSESYTYNNRNDIVATTIDANSQLRQTTLQVDRDKKSTLRTDTKANTSQQDYDALGRAIREIDTHGDITQFTYDNRHNLIQVTDPEGRTTRYTYDKNNRLTAEIKQNNDETTQYIYDATSNLIQIIYPDNKTTLFTYSDAGLLVKTQFFAQQGDAAAEKTITYTYHASGLLESYTDGTISTSYTYDKKQQLIEVTTNYGSFSKQFRYGYYPNGLKQSYTSPEGVTYTYDYDGDGKLTQVSIPDEGTYRINAYDWLAPTQVTFPGGGMQTRVYDDMLLLTQNSYTSPASITTSQSQYTYDTENNLTQRQHLEGETSYDYDNLYRLTQVGHTSNSATPPLLDNEAYSYDKVGNRLTTLTSSEDWQYNTNNQLLSSDAFSYDYDAHGNQISQTHTLTGETTYYVYNAQQRLTRIEDNEHNAIASYAYNPFEQRISKTVGSVTTYFLYTQEGLTAEYDQAGHLITEYHYTPDGTWMTNPLFMRTGNNNAVLYYHNDQLGTPQALYSKQGQLMWQAEKTAFGNMTITTNLVTQNLRFPGQYYDAESGLHYNYFRYYDPSLGRYITSDPIGLAGGINTYAYVGGNPLFYSDPFGETALAWCFGGPVGCAAGVLATAGAYLWGVYSWNVIQQSNNPIVITPQEINEHNNTDFVVEGPYCPVPTAAAPAPLPPEDDDEGKFKNDQEAEKKANELGYRKINERSNGQAVFRKGNSYITRDVDSHNGGAWKKANSVKNLQSRATRDGTYNRNLTKRIGD